MSQECRDVVALVASACRARSVEFIHKASTVTSVVATRDQRCDIIDTTGSAIPPDWGGSSGPGPDRVQGACVLMLSMTMCACMYTVYVQQHQREPSHDTTPHQAQPHDAYTTAASRPTGALATAALACTLQLLADGSRRPTLHHTHTRSTPAPCCMVPQRRRAWRPKLRLVDSCYARAPVNVSTPSL